MQIDQAIEPYTAKLMYSKFQSVEVASRYRDSQPQLVEKYSYLFNLEANIYKSLCLNTHFVPNNSDIFF